MVWVAACPAAGFLLPLRAGRRASLAQRDRTSIAETPHAAPGDLWSWSSFPCPVRLR
jgi:hypothetical protein